MAKMIPSVLSPEVKSDAEKRIFEWFRDAPGTEDWYVLHSLGLAYHPRVIRGETDFLVLAPGLGLFAMEVKGGRVWRDSKGIWHFKNRFGHEDTKERGPFDQGNEGIFGIVKYIKANLNAAHSHLQYVLYGFGVMMPDIQYNAGIEEKQWQVFDIRDARTGHDVRKWIEQLSDGAAKDWKEHFTSDVGSKLPSVRDIQYICDLLRPEFDSIVSSGYRASVAEEQQIQLTKEQYNCLDQLDDNKRLLISGGAGTGKTMLALEAARRYAAAGERVALFCYNDALGKWMRRAFEEKTGKPLYAGTFHSYMTSLIPEKMSESAIDETDWFASILPGKVIDRYDGSVRFFDRIIIDEAQDLISHPVYLDVMDVLLAGGISRGKWVMLGDFSMQAIYSGGIDMEQVLQQLEDRTHPGRYRLQYNCRNTKEICEEIRIMTGTAVLPDKVAAISADPPEWKQWKDQDTELEKLTETLDKLLADQVEAGDITILSPVSRKNSVVSRLTKYAVRDYSPEKQENRLTFSTIQSFKGLENRFIILTDIESVADVKLMYVAMSRARYGLICLASDKAKDERDQIYIRRLFS